MPSYSLDTPDRDRNSEVILNNFPPIRSPFLSDGTMYLNAASINRVGRKLQ